MIPGSTPNPLDPRPDEDDGEPVNGYTLYRVEQNGRDRWLVETPGGDVVADFATREIAQAWREDAEPYGAGADPYGRPDPQTHPEYWTE